jgi:hypothetical protein
VTYLEISSPWLTSTGGLLRRVIPDHETRLLNAVDELDEFLTVIALALYQLDKFPRPRDQQTFRWGVTRHRDAPSAAESWGDGR